MPLSTDEETLRLRPMAHRRQADRLFAETPAGRRWSKCLCTLELDPAHFSQVVSAA